MNLTNYYQLISERKPAVSNDLFQSKPIEGYTLEKLRLAFNEIVTSRLVFQASMDKVNEATVESPLIDISYITMLIDDLSNVTNYVKHSGIEIATLISDLQSLVDRFTSLSVERQTVVLLAVSSADYSSSTQTRTALDNVLKAQENLIQAITSAEVLNESEYVDFSGVSSALALPEATIAEVVSKTNAINLAVASLVKHTYILGSSAPLEDKDFGIHSSGYTGDSVMIRNSLLNKGTGDITNLNGRLIGENPEAFILDLNDFEEWSTTLNADRNYNNFSLRPMEGLAPGTYTATVEFTADNNIKLSFNIIFKVV